LGITPGGGGEAGTKAELFIAATPAERISHQAVVETVRSGVVRMLVGVTVVLLLIEQCSTGGGFASLLLFAVSSCGVAMALQSVFLQQSRRNTFSGKSLTVCMSMFPHSMQTAGRVMNFMASQPLKDKVQVQALRVSELSTGWARMVA
jgi:hypothetical protein